MAKAPGFRLDRKGVSKLLKGPLGGVASEAAEALGDQIRADHPELADAVDVQRYTTDRGAASVMVKDGRARELQIREGLITKAAAKLGMEVKTK